MSTSNERRADPQAGAAPNVPMTPGDEARTGTPGTGAKICPACGGTGRVAGRTCAMCQGAGEITAAIGGG
jgi:hypothetical protein